MDKSWLEHRLNVSQDVLMRKLDMLHDIPVSDIDGDDIDMIKDIWEAIHHMCEIKKMQ